MGSKWYILALRTLLVEILILMALGAFVRTMNAGLACPDWPLCFGKVIPDFHPGVWYEFIHRADAGLVAITYFILAGICFFSKSSRAPLKPLALAGLITLLLLISAGAMTVLKQVAWLAVTTHLGLATTFFILVMTLMYRLDPRIKQPTAEPAPRWLRWCAGIYSGLIFIQILLGGKVASTYAGQVCVDWPLCNGQWVPTWEGAIGTQIIHRFTAYALALIGIALASFVFLNRKRRWVSPQLRRVSIFLALAVVAQVVLGILNLIYFIPPWLTVPHQSLAVILLATSVRFWGEVPGSHCRSSAPSVTPLPDDQPSPQPPGGFGKSG